MASLEACPVCRTTLRESVARCPECSSDLAPFQAMQQQQDELVQLVRQLLSRGETAAAGRLLPRLSQLASLDPAVLAELNCRLAVASGEPLQARALLPHVGAAARPELEQACTQLEQRRRQAQELYNSALWQLRAGRFAGGAEDLAHAVQLEPGEAKLWQLKLKAELKARLYARCYASLAALDRLHARPGELARLEALLPPAA